MLRQIERRHFHPGRDVMGFYQVLMLGELFITVDVGSCTSLGTSSITYTHNGSQDVSVPLDVFLDLHEHLKRDDRRYYFLGWLQKAPDARLEIQNKSDADIIVDAYILTRNKWLDELSRKFKI